MINTITKKTNAINNFKSGITIHNREKEAKGLLQYWLNIANTKGWNEDGTFDYKGIQEALDVIEDMLYMYNIFSDKQLQLKRNNNTGIYKLVLL